MALPAVNPWNVGVNPTSTILNTNIRDLVQFIRNRPHAILRRITSTQNATSGTLIQVQYNTEDVDTDAAHDNVTNPSRYTVKTDGVYWLNATVVMSGNANGKRDAWFRVNGSTAFRYGWQTMTPTANGGGADICLNISAHLRLVTNDYVEVTVLQNSGTTLTLSASEQRLEVMWVGKL